MELCSLEISLELRREPLWLVVPLAGLLLWLVVALAGLLLGWPVEPSRLRLEPGGLRLEPSRLRLDAMLPPETLRVRPPLGVRAVDGGS